MHIVVSALAPNGLWKIAASTVTMTYDGTDLVAIR
jgi:hypothetical protein